MSDEAFARRFYSDRAELTALGVPLQSQRDEFTGEELYTLRSENYFLDRLELDDDELAALQTALYFLEGKFAYAEPLRLALQNLALGRPGFARRRRPTRAARVAVSDARLLARAAPAGSRSSSPRSRSSARSSSATGRPRRDTRARAHAQPVRAASRRAATGTSIGHDLDRDDDRARSASRASAATSASRRGGSATSGLPPDFDVEAHRVAAPVADRRDRRRGADRGRRATPPGGSSARSPTPARVEDGVFETDVREHRARSPAGCSARTAARCRSSPTSCVDAVADGARDGCASATTATPPAARRAEARRAAADRSPSARPARSRPSASACSRRCSRTCSPRAATSRAPRSRRRRARRRASRSRARSSRSTSRCSTSSTSAAAATRSTPSYEGDVVRVDKELYGDVFRTAAEADAARGARDPARDRVRRADDRRRGAHAARSACAGSSRRRSASSISPARRSRATAGRRGGARPTLLSDGAEKRRRRRDRVPEGGRGDARRMRLVEPYTIERELPVWRVHTWDRTRRRARGRSASTGCARRGSRATRFDARDGFDPSLPARSARRPALALARGRALEARARRTPAHRRLGDRRRAVQDRGVAPLRGARRSRRDGRARATTPPRRRRKARAPAPARARTRPQQTLIFT